MMRHKLTAVITLAAMAVTPVSLFAQAPDLSVQPVQCAAPDVHPRVTAIVPPSAVSGQVFFKAEGTTNEYYVDMRKAPDGTMWAYLPAPLPTTKSFTYRVVTLDNAGKRASSQLMTLNTSAACPKAGITDVERPAAAAIVVGLTSNSQQVAPAGFECKDIVSYITVAGEMRPNDECRRQNATGAPIATSSSAVPETAGLSRNAKIALTAAALAAAGVAIYNHNHKKQKSKSRPNG